ncbi:MAG: hypothetical protein JXK93_04260 [Sphaerochaetaceae bacterium]|nr:hypothetical protein [Sphaerochaetaceae bacterium]
MFRHILLLLILLPVLVTTGCVSSLSYTERYARSQRALYEGDYESASRIIGELLYETGTSVDTLSLALEHAIVTMDVRRALELIDRLIEVDRDSWYRHYGVKALLLLETGQTGKAVQLYREMHQRNPYDLETGLALIDVLRDQGRTEDVFEVARTLYTYHPESIEVIELLASLSDQESSPWSEVLAYEKTLR